MTVAHQTPTKIDKDLADYLLAERSITQPSIDHAIRIGNANDARLSNSLLELGLLSERQIADAFSSVLGLPVITAADFPAEPILIQMVSNNFLRTSVVLPICEDDRTVTLAMADPSDSFPVDAIQLATGKTVDVVVATPTEITAAIERAYVDTAEAAEHLFGELDDEEDVERLRGLASEAPIIKTVNSLIRNAIDLRASDIHIEPFENRLRVRYRIDGMLQELDGPAYDLRAAVVSRVKIMANLDIAERRLPQDGRIRLTSNGRRVDLRVSIVPTAYGESAVIRVLDQEIAVFEFRHLGIDDALAERLFGILDRPHGMLLVSGTTGSGKTTTLYAALNRLNQTTRKILTVEDPIEYNIDGVNQIQVRSRIGLEFDSVLRSILRQDPDVIMIGEIRDLKTAQIAVQAALTGHNVLSTVHTHNAASAIGRMLDMGVEDYLLTSTLNGVLSQRLVRRLCTNCREPYIPQAQLIERWQGATGADLSGVPFYRPKGCRECNGTGYVGRTVIGEVFVMSDAIRSQVLSRAETTELHRIAVHEGMETMYQHGMKRVLSGDTSLEEIFRVTRDA